MLTALSVALLYLACVLPMVRIGLCAAGGIIPAIPLTKRRVQLALAVYAATSALAAVILPQKSVAVAYIGVFGLYSLVKYAIEGRISRRAVQWGCKLAFALADGAMLLLLLQKGLMGTVKLAETLPWAALGFVWIVTFAAYDIAFSRLTSQLSRIFPDD